MAAAIHLYLDENISPQVAVQLRRHGINATSVHEMGITGESDDNHLARATELQQVIVTCDTDFLSLVEGVEHYGIVFGRQKRMSIGDWVTKLVLLCGVYDADDMRNHVEYV